MYIMIVGTCEIIMNFIEYINPGWNEDETRTVKRAVRVAWELKGVFLLFSIYIISYSLFLLVASPLLFLRFSTLVKLLTVRVITPTVTCRWYVMTFSFFLLLLMGNDLKIACFYNTLRLSCNSHDRSNEPNLSISNLHFISFGR